MITEPLHSTQAAGRRRGNKWMNKAALKASECRDSLISLHAGSRAQAVERIETPGECSHTALEGCISKMRQLRIDPLVHGNVCTYTDSYRCNIRADVPVRLMCRQVSRAMELSVRSEVISTFKNLSCCRRKKKKELRYIKPLFSYLAFIRSIRMIQFKFYTVSICEKGRDIQFNSWS